MAWALRRRLLLLPSSGWGSKVDHATMAGQGETSSLRFFCRGAVEAAQTFSCPLPGPTLMMLCCCYTANFGVLDVTSDCGSIAAASLPVATLEQPEEFVLTIFRRKHFTVGFRILKKRKDMMWLCR